MLEESVVDLHTACESAELQIEALSLHFTTWN